jgi:hypothetical protein
MVVRMVNDRASRWVSAGALALLAAVCCSPLMAPGWFENHEAIRPISRVFGAWQEVAGGDLYPRWISIAYLGKGAPVGDFYPPAFALLGAYAHALGVPILLAVKLLAWAVFAVGAVGVLRWAEPHVGRWPALVAATLYLFAPYHFLDIYLRGAMAEFASLAALPWLFVAIDALLDGWSPARLGGLAGAAAAVVLCHFLAALMIAPFAAAYAVARAVGAGSPARPLLRIAAGGALGAAASAFYWLPALVEVKALSTVRLEGNFTGYLAFFRHFVSPHQWLDPTWGFGSSIPDSDADTMSFQVGLLVAGAAVASAVAARWIDRRARRFVLLTLALSAGALWLTSAASRPFYALLPPFQMVQFPWRFLGAASLFLAAAGAGFAVAIVSRRPAAGPWVAGAVAILAVVLSVPQRAVSARIPLADEHAAIEAAVVADTWSAQLGTMDEYLPRDAAPETALAPAPFPGPWGLGVEIGAVRARPQEVSFEAVAPAGRGVAVVPWHWFPGWRAAIDGRDSEVGPGPGGFIALWVPEGRHAVRIHFGTTPPRVAGWLLAVAALATLAAVGWRGRRR